MVARLTRTQHATKVASTAERNTTTTTASVHSPRPSGSNARHGRPTQELTSNNQEPIAKRQARGREEHRIRIDADGLSSVNTKSLDSAGGVHVGTEDQAARLKRLEDYREDSDQSQESAIQKYQDQVIVSRRYRRSPSPSSMTTTVPRSARNRICDLFAVGGFVLVCWFPCSRICGHPVVCVCVCACLSSAAFRG